MLNIKMQRELAARAAAAARNAYAPYSKFRVGAALLPAAGRRVITGCNVENSSYGLTLCAERAALAAAIAAGFRRFKAIAVAVSGNKPAVPCGACLQVLAEFCGPDCEVFTVAAARPRKIKAYTMRALLPHFFKLNHE